MKKLQNHIIYFHENGYILEKSAYFRDRFFLREIKQEFEN